MKLPFSELSEVYRIRKHTGFFFFQNDVILLQIKRIYLQNYVLSVLRYPFLILIYPYIKNNLINICCCQLHEYKEKYVQMIIFVYWLKLPYHCCYLSPETSTWRMCIRQCFLYHNKLYLLKSLLIQLMFLSDNHYRCYEYLTNS